jgi:hypothetical protein
MEINSLLRDAELRVCLYLMAKFPFGNRMEIETCVIAEHLGLARRTVQKSIKRLHELALIDWEVTKQFVTGKWDSISPRDAYTDAETSIQTLVMVGNEKNDAYTDAKPIEISSRDAYTDAETSIQTLVAAETISMTGSQKPLDLLDLIDQDQIDQGKCSDLETTGNIAKRIINKSTAQTIPIAEDPDRDLKNFIIKTIEEQKGEKLTNPESYALKCLRKDRKHWEAFYQESLKPQYKSKEKRLDLWDIETTIAAALKSKNYEFAIARFNDYPEFREEILKRHPDWSKELIGVESDEKPVSIGSNYVRKIAMLVAKLKLPFLTADQKLETEKQIKELEKLLCR